MATATAPRAKRGQKVAVTVTPQDILAIASDTAAELSERQAVVREITLGALAGKNVHQLGPPGTGKSMSLREFCKRIVGANYAGVTLTKDDPEPEDARYFEKSVHAQMPADALIGGYDMPKFAETGRFERNVEHYLPNAHFGFIDEITRANGPTLDALLSLLNAGERQYEANGGMAKSPLLFIVTASNFMPDADDPQFGALVDRFTLMQYIDYVKSDESFKQMVTRAHERRQEDVSGTRERKFVTLDQFRLAQLQVQAIKPGVKFLDAYAGVRQSAKSEGLNVSDRRWIELVDIARASAWIAGRDELVPDDIAAIEPGLWRRKEEMAAAGKLVLPFHGRFDREAAKKREELAKFVAMWEEAKPVVEATKPGEDIGQDAWKKLNTATRGIASVKERVTALLAEAETEKRDAAGLRDLEAEINDVKAWCEANLIPHPIP